MAGDRPAQRLRTHGSGGNLNLNVPAPSAIVVVDSYSQRLLAGDSEGAWTMFLEQYGSIMLAVIRRYQRDYDDAMDAYAYVCEKLAEDDLARLRKYSDRGPSPAGFTPWLIVVVRNLVVDFIRQRDGRVVTRTVAGMSAIEKGIYELIFVQRRTHLEAYELLQAKERPFPSHGDFLRSLRAVHRYVFASAARAPGDRSQLQSSDGFATAPDSEFDASETAAQLNRVMETLDPEDRLAIRLFVEEDMPAADVATVMGWRNSKTVYNRVYRALSQLHKDLQELGIRREDLS